MILLVTGANGQLGRSFQKIAADFPDYQFHFYDSSQLDITSKNDVLEAVENLCPDYIINCAAYTAVEFGNNFVKTMLRLGVERDTLSVVNDQIGCPTYATDIATSTMAMIAQYPYNIESQITVNYANEGQISWYDFAAEIFRLSNIKIELKLLDSTFISQCCG